jgi:pilus assembly protein CpaB
MPAKTILTLLYIASLGLVAILGLRALPQKVNGATAANEEALVAATALPAGALLRAKDVAWRPLAGPAEPGRILRPVSSASHPNPERDQQAPAEVYGAALRTPVRPGEPITRGVLVKPGDRDFLQVVLFPKKRAIAIPVATGGASTGILYPGDWVDVMLTQTFKNDPPLTRRSVGETVVDNLRVLAIDPPDAKPAAAGNGFGRTVTLEVTPEQAEKINVATELGKLSLTLRSNSGGDGYAAASLAETARAAAIRPIWAGDVSPALGEVIPAAKVSVAEPPGVEVIHGSKIVPAKP